MFAVPSIVLIILGSQNAFDYRFYLGLGIALYGVSYVLFHDVWYHQRIKIKRFVNNAYLRAIIKAHDDHHTFRADKTMINYGFLWPPVSYLKKELSGK
jgi:beta-carotene 3-hydroxylase